MNKWDFNRILKKADLLIVVPPFYNYNTPSISVHVLQAYLNKFEFKVSIVYANIFLAAFFGEKAYNDCLGLENLNIKLESVFARVAFGGPPFGIDKNLINGRGSNIKSSIHDLEAGLSEWLDFFIKNIVNIGFDCIGFTSSYEQTNACIAMISKIKETNPEITTIIGGANCEDTLAKGMLSLSKNIDYVFSGESEISLKQFLEKKRVGQRISEQIIYGTPLQDLNTIPELNYSEYFEQLNYFTPKSSYVKANMLRIPFETSRGCWWGEKKQCTFCGVNGHNMAFRKKDPSNIMKHLKKMLRKYPVKKVTMVDNILSTDFCTTLFPKIQKAFPDVTFFYESKSNLSLEQLVACKKAGILIMQPGIEALSTSLLKKMQKGVLLRHNIAFLKYAKSLGIDVYWNLLYGFPGENSTEYKETLEIMKYITHLNPPRSVSPMRLTIFSEYLKNPDKYSISNIRPAKTSTKIFPDYTDLNYCSRIFEGDYASFTRDNPQIISALKSMVKKWRKPPLSRLELGMITRNKYLLIDTRNIPNTSNVHFINKKQAQALVLDRPINKNNSLENETKWALENFFLMEIDNWYLSLVIIPYKTKLGFPIKKSEIFDSRT
jgi:ribosomal peptide maturation radical SAM protein 1